MLDRIGVDKKRVSGAVRFVLVPHPGQAVIEEISLEEIKRQLLSAV